MLKLWEALAAAATLAAPVLVAGVAGLALMWFRLQRARLRAKRMLLPPSSTPPRPPWWESLRPRSLRPRQRSPLELELGERSRRDALELERQTDQLRIGAADEDDTEDTPVRRRPKP
jgi:hypothetical protein